MAIDYDQQFTGVVERIGIFDIKPHIKTQKVPSGEYKGEQFNIDKTHTVAFKIPELHAQWITVGHRKFREGYDLIYQIKKGDKYVDIWDGSTLTFMYAKNQGADGKTYINIETSSIRALKLVECDQKVYFFGDKKRSDESGKSTSLAYNSVGALQGNAFNGSMILLNNKSNSPKALETQLALKVINEEIKELFPKANGASIGLAILAGCREGKKIDKVKAIAADILTIQLPALVTAWSTPTTHTKEEGAQKVSKEPSTEGFDPNEIPF